jgi:hypothetical protein
MQQDHYRYAIKGSGLQLEKVQENGEYHLTSDSGQGVTERFGWRSIQSVFEQPTFSPVGGY